MALVNVYTTLSAVKDALNIQSTVDDASLEGFITGACRAIDVWCGQSFYDTGAASARTFRISDECCVTVDPFSTTTGLVIKTDDDDDGAYETTWTATDYELEPFGGDMANLLGAPYDTIHSVGRYFTTDNRRRLVLQVTARWGWAVVPAQVTSAAELISIDLWKRRDAPFGVTTTDFGPLRVSNDVVKSLTGLLGVFRRYDRVAGIA